MNFLLLNQTFHPDVVSTAQHLTDLALGLVQRGHKVTVVTGRRAYDDSSRRFPRHEIWRGVEIHRVSGTCFGKAAKWKRALDFASFIFACCWRLLFLRPPDVVVALTSPPLISFIGAWYARLRGCRFVYWVMDLNPDEALAAGWLKQGSFSTRILDRMSRFSLQRAQRIIALDRFMAERIAGKGIDPHKIKTIPPWSHDDAVQFDRAGRDQFRRTHGLQDKFVVMYSGNHSPCHPLNTVTQAAKRLSSDDRYAFLFVGGGSEFARVKTFAQQNNLQNILCLPYQPLSNLSASLSAADLHVVVMGERFVGTIHPCKIYNVLKVGAPVLAIGPRPSHFTDMFDDLASEHWCVQVRHGESDQLVSHLQRLREQQSGESRHIPASVLHTFSQSSLLPRLIAELESV